MSQELGKIEKPQAEPFKGKRKLFLVPLIYSGKDAPNEYMEKFERYWQQVSAQLDNLETKLGGINRIYHESIALAGEEGLVVMEKLNPKSCQIARSKNELGATLEAAEDKDLAEETMDWERCLLLGAMAEKVIRKLSEFYLEADQKRCEHIARRIDETLKEGETGVLFIREGHRVQFPPTVEIFSIFPPALDEIRRWFRERSEQV